VVEKRIQRGIIVLAALAAVGFVMSWTARSTGRRMRSDLLEKTRIAAQTVSTGRVTTLSGSATDRQSPDYLRLKDELARVRHATRECRFIYLLGRRSDGSVFFYVDSEPAGSVDESPPGQTYEEASEVVHRVFTTGQENTEGPIRDRWGTWVSAFVPVANFRGADTPVVLGMDVDARDWTMAITANSAVPAALTITLLIALGSVFLVARRSASPSVDRPVLRRLMLPLAGALILLVAGFGVALLWHQKNHLDELASSDIATIPEEFPRVLDLQADTLRVALRFIVDNPDMRAALKSRDRERLLLGHHALFATLRQEQGITHLYFHGPDRVNLLRVHAPAKWGDIVERFTTCEAQRTGTTTAGIELGPLGTFSLRVVEPVFDDDGLIGFVELGKEIEGVLEGLGSRHRIDIAVVVHKALLNRQEWEASMATLGREADWDRFPEDVLIYNSLPQLPAAIDPYVNEEHLADTDAKLELTFGGTSRRVAFLPLMDVSDSEVGHFLVLYDTSAQREAFARLLRVIGAGCLLLLALLLGFFYVVLKRTDQGIEARALALRESEAKWRSITENSADSILLLSPKLEVLFISRILPDLALEPLCGMSMFDFLPLESRHAAKVCFEQVLNTQRPAKYVSELLLATGQMGYFESTVGPVLCGGKVTALVVCARDVTDRKRAEEALQRESLFRKAIIANVAEGLCVCHETGDSPFWAFTVWNERMAEITGYTLDEINHLGWHRLLPAGAGVREQAVARLERVRRGDDVRNEEWTFIRRDGQERTLLMSASLLVSNSHEMHILALVQDVTERKQAERQLHETLARTERMNRLMEGREIRVLELKRRINELSLAAGQSPPYGSLQDPDLCGRQAEDPAAQAALPPAPEGPPRDYRIEDLLDPDRMQQLLDSYCDAVGISSGIIDLEGKVFVGARWQRICADFHRVNAQTCARCIESDTVLAGQLREGEGFSLYRCRNGLTDAASPIIMEGRHVANVFVGQFLLEPADEGFFRAQAREFGFDEAAYIEALSRVPVVSEQELPAILSYLTTCARLLAEMGLERIRARAYEADLLRQAEELNHANQVVRTQREAALSLAEDANEAKVAAERTDHSLRQSEEKYRNLVDNSLVGIGISQADRIVYANQSLLRMYGYDDFHEFASRSFLDYLTPQSRAFIQEWEARKERGEEVPFVFEHDIVRKDGAIRTLQLSVSPITMGDSACLQTAFIDITERKWAEKALQEESLFREAIIASAAEGLCVCHEIPEYPHVAFTIWNERMTEITGCTMDEINRLGWYQTMYPDPQTRAQAIDRMARMRRAEDLTSEEWVITRPDGQERTLLISTSVLVSNHPQTHVLAVMLDITQRKQLEKCVQGQLQLLQTLMDAIPYPVYYKDAQLRYLGCNRAWEKLLGIDKGQTVGRTIHDIAPKELADRYHAADVELLAHPGLQTYKGLLQSTDGISHEVLFRKATFQNAEGGIGGIVGVALDTTELMRAEEALLVKNSALNSAASGIVLMDLDGRLTYANPSGLKMWGFDHEQEVLDRPFLSLLRSQEEGTAAYQAALHTGAWCGELAARRKDGSEFFAQVSASAVNDKQGKPICLMASLVDVTESRRLNDILDRKQKNLEAIFDAAPLGMLLVNEQRRVARANDTIRQISGKGYRQILNQHPCLALGCIQATAEVQARDQRPSCETCSLQMLVEAAFESGSPVHGAKTRPVLSLQGEEVRPWFSVSIEPVNIDGDRHVLIALNDVTHRMEAEEKLRETMEMKSQFVSTVSHELRTPLTAMKEAVTIVADGIAGELSKDQTHFLDIARRNIDRLARLIDNVLDFQKLVAGKMKFHMQSNHIDRTIDEAFTTMLPHARQKPLHLSVDLEANLPPIVYDHDRMIQVLTNLLSNAIKFTPEGGQITISARRRGEDLAVSVRDSGMGIPKEALPKLFTQFYRVHRPGKEIKGTGLGLAIVSRIVADHGGRIDVESEVDRGTTFTVLLPLVPKPSAGGMSQQGDDRLESTLTNTTQA